MIRRLALLVLALGLGLGAVFFLPASSKSEPVGIKLALPDFVGGWYGVDQPVTQQEREILAGDTEFARKEYTNGAGDSIFASIVLSGHDLDNSIHRPERCLPAQGWTITNSRKLRVALPNDGGLDITRLQNVREVAAPSGKMVPIYNLNYYWFVGYHHLTASHIERTILDIQDRILKGYNQRWAYITITSEVTDRRTRFGRSESQTDVILQDFIRQLFPKIEEATEPAPVARISEKPSKFVSLGNGFP